jgi:hypothetical protein
LLLVFSFSLGQEFLDEGFFVRRAGLDRRSGRLSRLGLHGVSGITGNVGANESHGELIPYEEKKRGKVSQWGIYIKSFRSLYNVVGNFLSSNNVVTTHVDNFCKIGKVKEEREEAEKKQTDLTGFFIFPTPTARQSV